jgi:glycerol uptake facilitator-like aquaporin
MIMLTVLVGHFLAYPAYNRWLPVAIALAVALIIVLLGPVTGGVVNPARQFGPAAFASRCSRRRWRNRRSTTRAGSRRARRGCCPASRFRH